LSLGLDTLLSPLTSGLGLRTLGIHLLLEDPLTLLLGLGLVNMFDQSTLVLEGVTLAELIQLVVEVFVDLAGSSVLDKKASEDTEASHPENLARHSRVLCTLSLTEASVSADSSSRIQLSGSGSGVHSDRLADDESIADQLADGLPAVCIGNLVDLARIQPDLALATSYNGRRQSLLGTQVRHLAAMNCRA